MAADTPLLEMSPPDAGYCSVCQQPTKVGGLKMAGWPHRLWVCAACLLKLAGVVQKG